MGTELRIPPRCRWISKTAAREAGRYTLQGVNVLCKDGVATLAATDGRRLTRVTLPGGYEGPDCDVIVPAKDFEKALKHTHFRTARVRDDADYWPHVEIEEKDSKATFCEHGGGAFMAIPLIKGTFPCIEDVIPPYAKRFGSNGDSSLEDSTVGVNALLLPELIKATFECGGANKESLALRFSARGAKKPIRIDYPASDPASDDKPTLRVVSVLMPIVFE